MTDGHKIFLTAHYAFNYNESHYDHLEEFDVITQFFEHRNNLEGIVEDEYGLRIEEYSDIAIITDSLYEGFENKNIPKVVEKYLHMYEMYEVLAEYVAPLTKEALNYKQELILENE